MLFGLQGRLAVLAPPTQSFPHHIGHIHGVEMVPIRGMVGTYLGQTAQTR